MPNPFVHVELQTKDLDKAKKFYQGLFDWNLEEFPMGNGAPYTVINVGEGTGGGMWTNPAAPGAPSHWLAYVNVENIDATIDKVAALGGTVVHPKTEIPDMGWYSVITDPSGAVLGLWQNKPGQ